MMKPARQIGSLLGLLLAALGAAYAQSTYGTIVGKVTDPTGAVVAGASVTVTNIETNISNDWRRSRKPHPRGSFECGPGARGRCRLPQCLARLCRF